MGVFDFLRGDKKSVAIGDIALSYREILEAVRVVERQFMESYKSKDYHEKKYGYFGLQASKKIKDSIRKYIKNKYENK